tara:strand:+ start:4291 stop:4758 length:468 start_codon:yes stop_codon:yes gene_type:complete
MTPQEQILSDEFEQIRFDLIKRYDELGMRASGDFEKSLEVKQNKLSAELWGNHYIEQLVNGREPGKFPPIAAIEKWIGDKGISAFDISVSSLAFLIARKIAREGTEIFKKGGTDLVDSVITPERIQGIIDKVGRFYINEFTLNITNILKEVAQAA